MRFASIFRASLSKILRTNLNIDYVGSESCRYIDLVGDGKKECFIAKIDAAFYPGNIVFAIGAGAGSNLINIMLGGNELKDIKRTKISKADLLIVRMIFDRWLMDYNFVWDNYIKLGLKVKSFERVPLLLKFLSPEEELIKCTYSLSTSSEDALEVWIPQKFLQSLSHRSV